MSQASNLNDSSYQYRRERQVAVEAVRRACLLCRAVRMELVSDETLAKRDRSPVTVADFGAQAVISLALKEAFPADPVVGEEEAAALRGPAAADLAAKVVRHVKAVAPGYVPDQVLAAIDRCSHTGGSSGRFWTLDPIDGTKGFLRNEQYAVALALIEEGKVVLGVLGCPNLPGPLRDEDPPALPRSTEAAGSEGPRGYLFGAIRGEGVFVQELDASASAEAKSTDPDRPQLTSGSGRAASLAWTPVRVSRVEEPSKASFCESVEAEHSSHGDAARVADALGVAAPPLRMDSQCKYAAVARGDADIYLRLPTRPGYAEKIWDHAAGWIIVEEAGGTVTDIYGRALDFGRGRTLEPDAGVVASNGLLHNRVISSIRRVVEPDSQR